MRLKLNQIYLDEGYGLSNISTQIFLESLPEDKRIKYEKEMEKKNPIAYAQYKKWEKEMNSFSDEI